MTSLQRHHDANVWIFFRLVYYKPRRLELVGRLLQGNYQLTGSACSRARAFDHGQHKRRLARCQMPYILVAGLT